MQSCIAYYFYISDGVLGLGIFDLPVLNFIAEFSIDLIRNLQSEIRNRAVQCPILFFFLTTDITECIFADKVHDIRWRFGIGDGITVFQLITAAAGIDAHKFVAD